MPRESPPGTLPTMDAGTAVVDSPGGSNHRWLICALLFVATSINYLDRQVFGLLIPDLQRELHISEIEYGRLVMAFQLWNLGPVPSWPMAQLAPNEPEASRCGADIGLADGFVFSGLFQPPARRSGAAFRRALLVHLPAESC